MSDEKKDFKALKEEINSLKNQLNSINEDKEKWFKQKEDLKKEIQILINKVQEAKKESDVSSSEVDKLRKERDEHNKGVKELIKRIRELNEEKNLLLRKYGLKEDPVKIKEIIDKLNEKIETEVISFDKEKKLMEQIKRLKKAYDQVGNVKEITDKISYISKQIETDKEKANEAHKKLKEAMKGHRRWYRDFFSISKQINIIKKQQEKAFEMFISFKKKFVELSTQLRNKLMQAKDISKNSGREKEQRKEFHDFRRRRKEEKIIEEKVRKVEEKIKKGEKLTTEDLITMQGKKE